MPEGVNMECIGHYLQSLGFYVENKNLMLTFQSTGIKLKNKD